VWIVLCALVTSASAQEEPSSTELAAARALFYEGVEATRREEWSVAEERFARAYEIVRQPQTLINLAGARAHLGRLLEASETYREFLRLASVEERAQWAREVEAALATIERRTPSVVIEIDALEAADRLTLDGAPLSRAVLGVAVPLDPGAHRIAVVREEREVASRDVTLAEGARESIAIELPRVRRAVPPPVIPVEERVEDETSFWSSAWPWVIGAGLVAIAAGVVVTLLITAPDPFVGNVPPGHTVVP
jgi:hypothetical protein